MRILIYPHDLAMGGSQLNAIELAGGLRDAGHEVIIYGWKGELVERIREMGLEFISSPRPSHRPTPRIVAHLRRLAKERRIDIIHGFEWPPALEARLACVGLPGTRAVATVMSMAVADFIPRTMALTVGTEQILAERRDRGYLNAQLLEPPVDTRANAADPELGLAFRREHHLAADLPLVVVVGRLVPELKLEGILSAIDCAGRLAARGPLCLAIVGDGPSAGLVRERAAKVNAEHPGTVLLTGELADPRPAYAAADIALGMGGSALRALSFGTPLVVQGEHGFFKLLEPGTAEQFFWQGWYGVGTGNQDAATLLEDILQPLLADAERRRQLGDFGRELVQRRYALAHLAGTLEGFYTAAAAHREPRGRELLDGTVASAEFARYRLRRAVERFAKKAARDDFNSNTVIARAASGALGGSSGAVEQVVYLAGTYWEDVKGTDHRLATALAAKASVIWVDPPRTVRSRLADSGRLPAALLGTRVDRVDAGISRIQTFVPAGVRFPRLRRLYEKATWRRVLHETAGVPGNRRVIVHSSATARFPDRLEGSRILYATDDWVAGEQLMGLPAGSVARSLRENLAQAEMVLAVSPHLARQIDALGTGRPTLLLPNGCQAPEGEPAPKPVPRLPAVALIGQLNERLDLELLEQIRDAGLPLRIAGPVKSNSPAWEARLRAFLESPGVEWAGEIPAVQVPGFLAACSVGLTPYAATAFNEASFPLKTLDYLAAGLPTVSTDLPSSRWLDTGHVAIGRSNAEVIELLAQRVAQPFDSVQAEARRVFAREHSWERRAQRFIDLSSARQVQLA